MANEIKLLGRQIVRLCMLHHLNVLGQFYSQKSIKTDKLISRKTEKQIDRLLQASKECLLVFLLKSYKNSYYNDRQIERWKDYYVFIDFKNENIFTDRLKVLKIDNKLIDRLKVAKQIIYGQIDTQKVFKNKNVFIDRQKV